MYKLGMEMAALEIQSNLLDLSAADRVVCWMAMQWEMLSGGTLPRVPQHPSSVWGKGGDQVLPDPIQPLRFDVLDISLKLPSVAWMMF